MENKVKSITFQNISERYQEMMACIIVIKMFNQIGPASQSPTISTYTHALT